MISIIICFRDQELLNAVLQSVANTIGLPYEVVAIDNSKGVYSIFEAYNLGIKRSVYSHLCFMHEDITFITENWGQKVVDAFENNPNLGLLGVAGSSYKPAVPSGWSFESASQETMYVNIMQYHKGNDTVNKNYSNPRNQHTSQVASVDGVWFCTTRAVVEKIKFDDKTFSGFHCYDVDFSLSVLQHYEVAVTFEILLNHFSGGSFNDSWAIETLKLHNKWGRYLPINVANLSSDTIEHEEFKAFHFILPRLVGKPVLCRAMLQYMWQTKVWKLVGTKKFTIMNLLLLKKSFE
jgi:GT2 family glycosyltransferase